MKGDFTRSTFRPHKHYSGVRMQQGRVQLDADWNENLDILLHRIETETLDVIGECGVPVHDAAFGVVTAFKDIATDEEKAWLKKNKFDKLDPGDFYLTRGRAYVDGILVENDLTLPFSQQPYILPKGGGETEDEGMYLLYLDVWERHITALEDSYIREVALGGPDTATRMQVIWQARLAQVGKLGEVVTCADDLHPWPDASTGRLRARTHPEDEPDDPCTVPPGAGYKRLENQLYRVEIHDVDANTGAATFKWSRDNGSVAVAIAEFKVDGADTKIRTTSLGRDDVLGLHLNDWVEVLDDATELAGQPGTLAQITNIDPDNILTLSVSISGYDIAGHPKVRRWDSDGAQSVTVPVDNDGYLKLEGGVEVKFDANTFQTGDYWLIPARTVPGQYGDIEWPLEQGDPAALLPFGIVHHYCKLAVLTAELVDKSIGITAIEDCRKQFPPLTELPTGGKCCCSVSVGEGGDYPDIQSALEARPKDADEWHICINAGTHKLKDTITGKQVQGLVISGCGRQTHIIAPKGQPAFAFTTAEDIQLDNLWVDADSPDAAILFEHSLSITVSNCMVSNQVMLESDATGVYTSTWGHAYNRFGQPGPAIVVKNGKQVEIRDNDIFGFPAVLANGANLSILGNRAMGGGIQVVAPSLTVQIEDNLIAKGLGPGIQLGGGADDFSGYIKTFETGDTAKPGSTTWQSRNPLAGIRNARISNNLIGGMRGSGIVTELSLAALASLSDVEGLSISDNQIVSCCARPDVLLDKKIRVGGGIAMIGIFSAQISRNFIAANGSDSLASRIIQKVVEGTKTSTAKGDVSRASPACGIFVLDGSDIDISDNAVLENGTDTNDSEPDAYQAGIAAQYVLGNYLGTGQDSTGKAGYPALRVCGNRVVCPAGQALSVVAVGSVVVDGNTFVSRERLAQPTQPLTFGEKGACVFVFNLGLPVWLPEMALVLQMMASGQTNLHVENFQKMDAFFSRFPDGRILFNNNQVTFNTDLHETVESLGQFDSQWFARAWKAATFSTLLISLDDISIAGNQFQASVPLYVLEGLEQYTKKKLPIGDLFAYLLKFIHVGSSASSVRATGNGLNERLYSNWISYASNAVAMNATTSNEATHAFATNAPKKAEANNLSLFS